MHPTREVIGRPTQPIFIDKYDRKRRKNISINENA